MYKCSLNTIKLMPLSEAFTLSYGKILVKQGDEQGCGFWADKRSRKGTTSLWLVVTFSIFSAFVLCKDVWIVFFFFCLLCLVWFSMFCDMISSLILVILAGMDIASLAFHMGQVQKFSMASCKLWACSFN